MTSRLKSLELQGYKTFASRVILEYPSQITAVVGPNGAGKSNVADAIRWVLGEQSYSLLRGRKTEDMIFAGSEQRPRASMASASITFRNEDGWLPIDFSEVAITRRAYRDGQNEYLLNGQRVRLKEISELLSQSGLAERTYTIIGQGLVDSALSLKPDERRRFFEEAAGIGLYRGRREEAINRLDSTRRNTERVQDILAELEPRLQSLERQARKVQEYERIKADLQLLLRDWYGYFWHKSQQDLVHAKEALRAQEVRSGQARTKLAIIEERLNGLRNKLQIIRADLNSWHSELADYHQKREKVSRELAIQDERKKALLEQQFNYQIDLVKLEEDHRSLRERIGSLIEERNQLQAECNSTQVQVEKTASLLSKRQSERQEVEKIVIELQKELLSLETRQLQRNARQDELINRVENIRQSIISIRAAYENDIEGLKNIQKRFEKTEKLRDQAEFDLEEAEGIIQKLRAQREQLEGEKKNAQIEELKLESEKARLNAQIQVLADAQKSFSGLNQGAKYLLESVQRGQLPGSFIPLSSQMEVPIEYEIAISAVLGELLYGIVVEDKTDPENALLLLERAEKGRAVLLLLDIVNDNEFKINEEGTIGNASDLVHVSPRIKPLIKRLLGNVLLVKDRNDAQKMLNKLPLGARIVTLRGEVFSRDGIVIAGQDGRPGVISRPRQMRELQETLDKIESMFGGIIEQKNKGEKTLGKVVEEEKKAIKELNLLIQRSRDMQKTGQQAKLELEQSRQRIDWHQKQILTFEQQLQKTQEEIDNCQNKLEEDKSIISTLNLKIKETNRKLFSLPMDEFQTLMAHWNTNAAVAAQSLKNAENRLNENQQTLLANEKQQEIYRQRLSNVDFNLKELESARTGLRNHEITINRQIEAFQSKIDPVEKELETINTEFGLAQNDQIGAQQLATLTERYVTQAQSELSHQREVLENLRHKIEDDFGLVAYEYSMDVSGQEPLPLGSMVEQLPVIKEMPEGLEENISRQRTLLRRLGPINPEALNEYQSVSERYNFLKTQMDDLVSADSDLRKVINELDELMRREFSTTFNDVAVEFRLMFTRLFGGGSARLVLIDDENPTETGIDIEARLPGRREQGLSLLSGGERSLTAVALIFALLKVSPTPFCVLDEVDAMLDEANVGRFCELLQELSQKTQFIVITHNRNTVQTADVIYGVTMGRDSASQLISLKIEEVNEDMAQ